MQFVRSVVAQCYRQGKPLGRRDFSSSPRRSFHNGGAKGTANRTPPDKPVVIRGSSAPGLGLFFGYSGYMIWQIVENVRITKATKKCTEYRKEARLRNTRVSEGYNELFRFIDEAKAEAANK